MYPALCATQFTKRKRIIPAPEENFPLTNKQRDLIRDFTLRMAACVDETSSKTQKQALLDDVISQPVATLVTLAFRESRLYKFFKIQSFLPFWTRIWRARQQHSQFGGRSIPGGGSVLRIHPLTLILGDHFYYQALVLQAADPSNLMDIIAYLQKAETYFSVPAMMMQNGLLYKMILDRPTKTIATALFDQAKRRALLVRDGAMISGEYHSGIHPVIGGMMLAEYYYFVARHALKRGNSEAARAACRACFEALSQSEKAQMTLSLEKSCIYHSAFFQYETPSIAIEALKEFVLSNDIELQKPVKTHSGTGGVTATP